MRTASVPPCCPKARLRRGMRCSRGRDGRRRAPSRVGLVVASAPGAYLRSPVRRLRGRFRFRGPLPALCRSLSLRRRLARATRPSERPSPATRCRLFTRRSRRRAPIRGKRPSPATRRRLRSPSPRQPSLIRSPPLALLSPPASSSPGRSAAPLSPSRSPGFSSSPSSPATCSDRRVAAFPPGRLVGSRRWQRGGRRHLRHRWRHSGAGGRLDIPAHL